MVADGGRGLTTPRRVYLTRMTDCGTEAVAAALRSVGIQAEVLPPPDARSLELGSRHLGGEECLPAKVTLGDYLKVVEAPGFDPAGTAFMMPTTEGPCRFGQYAPFIRKLLADLGYPEAAVLSPSSGDAYARMDGATASPLRAIWRAVVASDLLRKLLLRTRPYERTAGDADAAYARSLCELCAVLETPRRAGAGLAALREALVRTRDRFRAVPTRYERGRLWIGVQGEIFCRMNAFSNQDLIRHLEACGGEAWLSDISEWVWYCNAEQEEALRHAGRGFSLAMARATLRDRVQRADEEALRAVFAEDFAGAEEPHRVEDVLAAAEPYLPRRGASGEMVLSAGKVDHLFRKGADGVIDISPFSCMNGIVSEALYPRQSREHAGMPIKSFYFDGTERDLTDELEIFLELARAYQQQKPHARHYPPCFE